MCTTNSAQPGAPTHLLLTRYAAARRTRAIPLADACTRAHHRRPPARPREANRHDAKTRRRPHRCRHLAKSLRYIACVDHMYSQRELTHTISHTITRSPQRRCCFGLLLELRKLRQHANLVYGPGNRDLRSGTVRRKLKQHTNLLP
jgi:hypothetical protein